MIKICIICKECIIERYFFLWVEINGREIDRSAKNALLS